MLSLTSARSGAVLYFIVPSLAQLVHHTVPGSANAQDATPSQRE